jgi:AcrR family transcriptional regulator
MPATTTRRDQQRRVREENRARIVAAAEDALRQRPFREVSIDDVMGAAGLTRTIFYRHFDDMSDLLVKVAGPVFDELFELERALADVERPDLESLRAALEPAVETFVRHGPLVRAIAEAAGHDAAVESAYREVFERYVDFTAATLRRFGASGPADPDQIARALTFMNVGYLIDAFGGAEPKVAPAAALDAIAGIWARTLV